ncbi:MAG: hypothetical protein C0490_25515 [Marivirga sp.]|nr:hypothetical protein [Marivirga sp.]
MKKKIRRRAASATDKTGFFEKKEEQPFFSKNDAAIQRQPSGEPDRIHGPLLDQYSKDSGLPRDSVTQHDPGYKIWLQQRSTTIQGKAAPALPINIILDMNAPATDPAPDYSKDETQLGAWERANFLLNVQQSFSCDKIVNNGIESSFVTDIGIRFTRADFEYFIARHIYDNMTDRTKDVSERIIWRRIHGRILIHSREHFARYRQVVDSMRQDFLQRFSALPNKNNPIQISQQELEAYVSSLLQYLVAKLQFELWKTTCNWEHADYPNLLKGIPNVSGRFVPACGQQPVVPPAPILPIVVTPSTPLTPGKKKGSP